jgi:hypothetical protein
MPEAIEAIAKAARSIAIKPDDEVWCASGSDVLARGLVTAWPNARRHVVQVGRTLNSNEVAGAFFLSRGASWAKGRRITLPHTISKPHRALQ